MPSRAEGKKAILILLLGLLALATEALAVIFHTRGRIWALLVTTLVGSIPFLIAVWLTFRNGNFPRWFFLAVVALAIAGRGMVIPLNPPYLSTDVYRYIWDGRVQAHGISPYSFVPAAPELKPLRDEAIYPNINRRDYAKTIYPPIAQFFFWLSTRLSESLLWFKCSIGLVDLATIAAIALLLRALGQPIERVVVYAWHPLPVWEFAGTGHIDAIMILFIVLAFLAYEQNRPGIVGALLACATLVKFIPVLLLPAFYRRWDRKLPVGFLGVIAAAYLPYLILSGTGVLGFLPQYFREEGVESGDRFFLLNLLNRALGPLHFSLPPAWFVAVAGTLLLGLGCWAISREPTGGRTTFGAIQVGFLFLLIATLLLSSNYPWYYACLIPFLCPLSFAPALYLTIGVFVLYRGIIENLPDEQFGFQLQLFLPFYLLSVVWFLVGRRFPLDRPGHSNNLQDSRWHSTSR
jgi:alpha-1,6-mannosyltransferase